MNSCLAACISLSVYNAHDMIIRFDKRSHGRISGKRLRVVGFRKNWVAIKLHGKTTGNRFDFEIAELLRIKLARIIEGQLCSEIPCLVAWGSPAVWAREVCLSNEPSIRAIFSHTNITGRAIPIYRSDSVSLSTHHHFSESQKISKRRIEPRSRGHAECTPTDWARSLRLSSYVHD